MYLITANSDYQQSTVNLEYVDSFEDAMIWCMGRHESDACIIEPYNSILKAQSMQPKWKLSPAEGDVTYYLVPLNLSVEDGTVVKTPSYVRQSHGAL